MIILEYRKLKNKTFRRCVGPCYQAATLPEAHKLALRLQRNLSLGRQFEFRVNPADIAKDQSPIAKGTKWVTSFVEMKVGRFRVRRFGDGKFWISNGEGEAMEISERKLARHIGTFFEREF